MNPFYNSNDLQSLVENFTKPWVNGFPFTNGNFQDVLSETFNKSMPGIFGMNPTNQLNPFNQPNQSNQFNSSNQAYQSNQPAEYQTFETHEFVIVRVTMPNQNNTNNIRLFIDSHQLTIKGANSNSSDLKINLPAAVKPKYAKADYQNGILEIRLIKKGPEALTEISLNTDN